MSDVDVPARPGSPSYTARTGAVLRISLGIGFLNLITLTFYRFWGTTRLRRYFWSHVSYDGEPLEYIGKGSELFIGFLIAVAILVPIIGINGFLSIFLASLDPATMIAITYGQAFVIYFLIYVALYRARRYRLSRTVWRGIRAGQTGSSLGYALRALMYVVLAIVTLGLAVPLKNVRLYRLRMNNTWYGTQDFRCEAKVRPLFKRWLVAWLLFIPTIGIIWFWYKAREERYLVGATTFQSVRFTSRLLGRQLFKLFAVYFLVSLGAFLLLILVLSIGVGIFAVLFKDDLAAIMANLTPEAFFKSEVMIIAAVVMYTLMLFVMSVIHTTFLVHRGIAMVCRNLTVIGEPDYTTLTQSDRAVPGFGEGLADALGAGSI